MLCFTGTSLMVSNITDVHPTPEGTTPKDHVISSRAHGTKMADYEVGSRFLFLGSCPFIINLCVMLSEMASCTFYCDAIRSCTRVLYGQRQCCLRQ